MILFELLDKKRQFELLFLNPLAFYMHYKHVVKTVLFAVVNQNQKARGSGKDIPFVCEVTYFARDCDARKTSATYTFIHSISYRKTQIFGSKAGQHPYWKKVPVKIFATLSEEHFL